MSNAKVWFVTGASKGLGLSLVTQLLAAGQKVAATSRKKDELVKAVDNNADNFLPLQVDLVNEESVAAALADTHQRFGRIDVIVNNAGYGIGGSIEELTDAETREAFDINVFATLNVIRKAMPYLRAQRAGHIINISSIAGFTANTGWGIYAAAKFAIVGMSEVLAQDVRPLGIHVTVVAPGAFRTSFLTEGSLVLTGNPIEEYHEVRATHQKYKQMDGVQAGDPEKAAKAMIEITAMDEPPVYLLLGDDAYERAFRKMDVMSNAFKRMETLTKSTGF
ncbi:MAG: SDR family NAD(P)-dependent oxidoreductase [Chitinophagaceae bacterium]